MCTLKIISQFSVIFTTKQLTSSQDMASLPAYNPQLPFFGQIIGGKNSSNNNAAGNTSYF